MFYKAPLHFAVHVNATKLQLHDPTPRRRCRTIMQNPIGFDLGTISRPGCWAQSWGWEGRGVEKKEKEKKQEASLIEFYVAVVGDLNMPEFITRRIIMPYKKWQSQIGPHTSSLPPHHWGGPVTAAPPPLYFRCIRRLPSSVFFSLLKMKHLCLTLEPKKNQYEFRNHP